MESSVVVDARIAHGILSTAAQGDFDLIAIATHGRGGVRRMMLGSVADKVIRGADTTRYSSCVLPADRTHVVQAGRRDVLGAAWTHLRSSEHSGERITTILSTCMSAIVYGYASDAKARLTQAREGHDVVPEGRVVVDHDR